MNAKKVLTELRMLEACTTDLQKNLLLCKEPLLLGLGKGLQEANRTRLTKEQQIEKDKLDNALAMFLKNKWPTSDLLKQLETLTGDENARFLAGYKSVVSPGNGASTSTRESVVGRVLSCQFKSDMVVYRFVSVTSTEWYLYTYNVIDKTVKLVRSSTDLQFNDDTTPEIESATRARIMCKYNHTRYTRKGQPDVAAGVDALQSIFLHNFDQANAGGVGQPCAYTFGKYAILLEEPAESWRTWAVRTGTAPIETRVKRETSEK